MELYAGTLRQRLQPIRTRHRLLWEVTTLPYESSDGLGTSTYIKQTVHIERQPLHCQSQSDDWEKHTSRPMTRLEMSSGK